MADPKATDPKAAAKAEEEARASSEGKQEVVVEGRPLNKGDGGPIPLEEQGLNPSALARAQGVVMNRDGTIGPSPDAKAVQQLASDKIEAAAKNAGLEESGAQDLLNATSVEPLWVPDNEKLSVYASPIAKQTFDEGRKEDASGTSENAPDNPDKLALANGKKDKK